MKKVFIVILVVTVLALSCGQVSPTTNVTSDLGLMLSTVPSELASTNILWFSNMERIKELAGVSQVTNADEFIRVTPSAEYQHRLDLLAGYTLSTFSGGAYTEYWPDGFGYSMFDINQEIMAQSLFEPNTTRPLFSVMNGNFDKNRIIGKLTGIGYQLKNYASIDYYSINADYQISRTSSSAAQMAMYFLNRMMVKEQEIIAAPADEFLFSVLDVRSGKQKSLESSLAYTRIAESLGDVLGAALIPQSLLHSKKINAGWNNLHSYDLAGIGYQVEGQDRKIVIALHYPDKSAADDITELNRRMTEYSVTAGGLNSPPLSDLFDIGDPEFTVYGPDSVLKVVLTYKVGTPGALWSVLVESQDLGFLVSNPSE